MTKKFSNWVPVFVVPFGGLLMLGLTFFAYLLVYLTIESLFSLQILNPWIPDWSEGDSWSLLFLVYLFLERTKLPKLFKATIMVGPYSMVLVTIVLQYYNQMPIALMLVSIVTAMSFLIFYKMKRPWFYYYAAFIAILAGLAYGWPRP